jgi:hypothetical protein
MSKGNLGTASNSAKTVCRDKGIRRLPSVLVTPTFSGPAVAAVTITIQQVPEPTTLSLLSFGVLGSSW